MSNYKTKVVDGLPVNFESTDPKDFVEILNKIAETMGGVSNMGVFADITSVTQSNEMIANVADKYITVSTKRHEMPHDELVVTDNIVEPYQFDLDTLAGKNGSNIPPSLERFLANEGKTKETKAPAKPKPLQDDDDDDDSEDDSSINDSWDDEDEIDDENTFDDDRDSGRGRSGSSDIVDKAIKSASKQMTKEIKNASKQMTDELIKGFKDSFKF